MPDLGDVWSSTWGSQWDKVHRINSALVSGGLLKATIDPSGVVRGRNYAVFINGKYARIMAIPMTGDLVVSEPIAPGGQVSSVYLVDVGDWDSFGLSPSSMPGGWIEEQEAAEARRIRMSWDSTYSIVGPIGDSQLSSITLTGMTRGMGQWDASHPHTRKVFNYTITTLTGGNRLVRLWAGSTLLAQGSVSGGGAITLSEFEKSGVNGSCWLSWAHDVSSGATIQARWNDGYQMHYSTSPLAYPRTPEAIIEDDGSTSYSYLTPLLPAGSYNYNVLPIDDNGLTSDSPPVPSDSPKPVHQPPAAPTITGASGCHGAISLYWTQGEPACRYKVMSSNNNEPPNDGSHVYPPPFTCPTGATSTVIPPVLDWGFHDLAGDLAGLDASVESSLFQVIAAWQAGETGFAAVLAQQMTLIQLALRAFGDEVGTNTQPMIEAIGMLHSQMDGLSGQSSGSAWPALMEPELSWLVAVLGQMIQGNPMRWSMPGGIMPAQAPIPTISCLDLATPSPRPCRLHCIVRAWRQSDGIEEHNDQDHEIELDQYGCVVQPRPNDAWIWSVYADGLALSVTSRVTTDDSSSVADGVDLFVVPAASSIDYSSPQATAALGPYTTGVSTAIDTYSAPSSGFYRFAILARAGGSQSLPDASRERVIYLADAAAGLISGLEGLVIRARE